MGGSHRNLLCCCGRAANADPDCDRERNANADGAPNTHANFHSHVHADPVPQRDTHRLAGAITLDRPRNAARDGDHGREQGIRGDTRVVRE